jgi:hypothetical protein
MMSLAYKAASNAMLLSYHDVRDAQRYFIIIITIIIIIIIIIIIMGPYTPSSYAFLPPSSSLYACRVRAHPSYPTLSALTILVSSSRLCNHRMYVFPF